MLRTPRRCGCGNPRPTVLGCREPTRRGLTYGKSAGNISVRRDERSFFVSPTGMSYESLAPDDIPLADSRAAGSAGGGRRARMKPLSRHLERPSSGKPVPPFTPIRRKPPRLPARRAEFPHFTTSVGQAAGGADIRCAPYYTFGSEELSAAAVEALKDRAACLPANHGVIALGRNLEGALSLAGENEDLAAGYCTALALGEIRTFGDAEMERVIDKFRTYGKKEVVDPGLEFGGRVAPRTLRSRKVSRGRSVY